MPWQVLMAEEIFEARVVVAIPLLEKNVPVEALEQPLVPLPVPGVGDAEKPPSPVTVSDTAGLAP